MPGLSADSGGCGWLPKLAFASPIGAPPVVARAIRSSGNFGVRSAYSSPFAS